MVKEKEVVAKPKIQRLVNNTKVEQRKKQGWKEVDISTLKEETLKKMALKNQDCVLMEK